MNWFFRRGGTCVALVYFLFLLPFCAFAEGKLSVRPDRSSGLPGELQQIDLTIEMDSPRKAVLRVPHSSNLVLRAVERYPVTRSLDGLYLQKRQLVFQGVEPGMTVFTNLLVEAGNKVICFPLLTVEVLPVEKTLPPKPPEEGLVNAEVLVEMPGKTH